MKKHVIGLGLFSFIVGAAAIAYAVFNSLLISNVSESQSMSQQNNVIAYNLSGFREKFGKTDENSPTIKQAIFNTKTKKLSWKCDSSRVEAFHIWVRDENGARYIHSFFTENCSHGIGTTKVSFVFLDSNKLSSQPNLYLIPDATIENAGQLKKFDIDKTIPVTIDYGK